MNRSCPALLISAAASGQGKTTVTAALARYHRNRGRKVRVFKSGPDFLDPMVLQQASGNPVYQLDLWMGGEADCRQRLYEAAGDADLILIEGVMGLFDGDHSSADLAALFNIPVLAVIDSAAMAQSFGAVAHGLASYRAALPFAGVFANCVAGEGHYQMLAESLPPGLLSCGWLAHTAEITLPERHLGLVQADEISALDSRIARAAAALKGVNEALPPAVVFAAPTAVPVTPQLLTDVRIAVACDAAFSFLYLANVDLLRKLGAELTFFSPLDDSTLPVTDAIYLPGGYPELHLERLAANRPMKAAIRAHHAAAKPIVAECGGMLYLVDSLADIKGQGETMVGLLPGKAVVQRRLANLGLHRLSLPEGELRGHTFHHSSMVCEFTPLVHSAPARHNGTPEPLYRQRRLTASYLHLYFPSNPAASARLFLP